MKLGQLIFGLGLFFFPSVLLANKSSLHGKITDAQTHLPLPGVEVYIPELFVGAVTDTSGNYHIHNLPHGTFLVKVSMVGYETYTRKVDITLTAVLDVELKEAITEMNEVVISALSGAYEILRYPMPMVNISKQKISEGNSSNIIDVLTAIPGLNTISSGPNVSKPVIRGLGYNRVLTLFDGVRQDGQQWGEEHGVEVDQFLVDRIEVIKGPASLTYGSDALAGVINLIPATPVGRGSSKIDYTSSYFSNNKQIANSFAYATNTSKGFAWSFRASQKMASNYQNNIDGRVFGSKYNEKDLNGQFGWYKQWGYSYLNFSIYDNEQEIPSGFRDSLSRKFMKTIIEDSLYEIVSDKELNSYTIGDVYQRVQHSRVYSHSKFIIGKSKLALKFGYQQSYRREYEYLDFKDIPALSLKLHTGTYDVKFHFPKFYDMDLIAGLNGFYQVNLNPKATEFLIPNYNSYDVGPFIYFKKEFNKWDIAGGIRYDYRHFASDDLFVKEDENGLNTAVQNNPSDSSIVQEFVAVNSSYSGMSGSLGFSYKLTNKLSLKANIARGYRSPSVTEVTANGIHPGSGYLQIGDKNLQPEFSLQEDIGIFFESDHSSIRLEVFNNSISNYIYNEKLSSVFGGDSIYQQNGQDFEVFQFRQTQAQLYGAEFSFDIHPHPLDWLHVENAISFVYGINRGGNGVTINDDNRYLPTIPPLKTYSELRAEFHPKKGKIATYYFKGILQYFAAQDRVFTLNSTESKTPGYSLVDLGFGLHLQDKHKQVYCKFSMSVTNLFDVAYQNHLSRLKYLEDYSNSTSGRYGIFNMGRNLVFKLQFPIDLMHRPDNSHDELIDY